MIKVWLLSHTPQPEKTVASAARVCYSAVHAINIVLDKLIPYGKVICKTITYYCISHLFCLIPTIIYSYDNFRRSITVIAILNLAVTKF